MPDRAVPLESHVPGKDKEPSQDAKGGAWFRTAAAKYRQNENAKKAHDDVKSRPAKADQTPDNAKDRTDPRELKA